MSGVVVIQGVTVEVLLNVTVVETVEVEKVVTATDATEAVGVGRIDMEVVVVAIGTMIAAEVVGDTGQDQHPEIVRNHVTITGPGLGLTIVINEKSRRRNQSLDLDPEIGDVIPDHSL